MFFCSRTELPGSVAASELCISVELSGLDALPDDWRAHNVRATLFVWVRGPCRATGRHLQVEELLVLEMVSCTSLAALPENLGSRFWSTLDLAGCSFNSPEGRW